MTLENLTKNGYIYPKDYILNYIVNNNSQDNTEIIKIINELKNRKMIEVEYKNVTRYNSSILNKNVNYIQKNHKINKNSMNYKIIDNTKQEMIRQEISEEEKKIKEKIMNAIINKDKNIIATLDKKIRFQLNILAPTNIDKIKNELDEIKKQNPDHIDLMGNLIFDKASSEYKYTKIYAELCKYLSEDKINGMKFRSKIIELIKNSFYNNDFTSINKKNIENMNEEEKQIYKDKKKKKIMGNILFISELIVIEFIKPQVIFFCSSTLLTKFFDDYNKTNKELDFPTINILVEKSEKYEIHIESLIKLLENIGKYFLILSEKKILDNPELKKSKKSKSILSSVDNNSFLLSIDSICQQIINGNFDVNISIKSDNIDTENIFESLNIVKTKIPNLSTRIKSLITNLQEKKKNNWTLP